MMTFEYNWHDAKTDPPTIECEYLVHVAVDDYVFPLIYEEGEWRTYDDEEFCDADCIDYWTDFPEPPEMVEAKLYEPTNGHLGAVRYSWHDAKKTLPVDDDEYLVHHKNDSTIFSQSFADGKWRNYYDFNEYELTDDIDYWTEFPAPPKEDDNQMKVTLVMSPQNSDLIFMKQCIRITMGKASSDSMPSSDLVKKMLTARHSPIRVLNFGFLITNIPSNTATHLARHVHAVPFISSLRNDRQDRMDGDNAPRNTPVDMIFYCNAEELMTIANKRLCKKAAAKTREVVKLMCEAAESAMPELKGLLVPMCEYCGGVCHEPIPCWMEGEK